MAKNVRRKTTRMSFVQLARNRRHGFSSFMAIFFILSVLPSHAFSAQNWSISCDRAAVYASQKTGVPLSVLQAISLTETGRKNNGIMRPWPWTVNMEGKGVWFENEDGARAYVYKHYKRGARSFDVGCFQINYKWHGHAFSSIEEMFSPKPNALYAAKFLSKLYQEKGSWVDAAGAYHSRTVKHAEKYKKRFKAYHASILASGKTANALAGVVSATNSPPALLPKVINPRINLYPLLQQNDQIRSLGSLAPVTEDQNTRRFILMGNENG